MIRSNDTVLGNAYQTTLKDLTYKSYNRVISEKVRVCRFRQRAAAIWN